MRRRLLSSLVALLFTTCTVARAEAPAADAFALPDGRRHVVLDGASSAMVGGLFGGDDVTITSQALNTVPWRPIDAVAFGPTRLAAAETLVPGLLARGAVVLVATDARPAGPWPWQRVAGGWMVRYDVAGPAPFVAPAVYASADLRPMGRPPSQRRKLVLLVTLYVLGTLGVVLLVGRRRRRAIVAVAAMSLVASGGLVVWGDRQDRVHSTGVTVVVQSGELQQVDRWTFERAPAPTDRQVDAAVAGWLVFRSAGHRSQSRATMVDDRHVAYRVDRDAPMTLLLRTVTAGTMPSVAPTPIPLRLRSMASQYTTNDIEVLGMTDTADGPTIWLRRDPSRGGATLPVSTPTLP